MLAGSFHIVSMTSNTTQVSQDRPRWLPCTRSILMKWIATKPTLTRPSCRNNNSHNLNCHEISCCFFPNVAKCFWACDLVELVQNQHASIPLTSKKVKHFGEVSFTRLHGCKEKLHLLVMLLMLHALNLIPPDQANKAKKLVSSMKKGQYSLTVII